MHHALMIEIAAGTPAGTKRNRFVDLAPAKPGVNRMYYVGTRSLAEFCQAERLPYTTVIYALANWPTGEYYQAWLALVRYHKLKRDRVPPDYTVRRAQIVARRWSKAIRSTHRVG